MENQPIQTPLVTYSWDQIEVALQGIPEDFRVRFKNTFSFDCNFIAIKSMEDWVNYANRGKNLWGLIAPKALLLGCDTTGEAFKAGRKPSNKKIFECTDGTILMFAIQAIDNQTNTNLTIPSTINTKYDTNFVNVIFKRINNQIVALPLLDDIKADLQLSEIPVNVDNWQLQIQDFESIKKDFDGILTNAIEDAYAGTVTNLPVNYDDVKAKLEWIENLNQSITYDIPDKIDTLANYILKVKQIIAIAIIRIKAGLNLPISNNENEYLTLASQQLKVEENVKSVETISVESTIKPVNVADTVKLDSNEQPKIEIKPEVVKSEISPAIMTPEVDKVTMQVEPEDHSITYTEAEVEESQPIMPQILGRGTTVIPEIPAVDIDTSVSESTETIAKVEKENESIETVASSIVEEEKESIKEAINRTTEIATDVPRPSTAIPIKATMVSIDPETHKVEVKDIELERSISNDNLNEIPQEIDLSVQVDNKQEAMVSNKESAKVDSSQVATESKISPEQAAHNVNQNLTEINALADELEAFISLDQFKSTL